MYRKILVLGIYLFRDGGVYTNGTDTMWKDLIDFKHNTNRPNILAITNGTSNFLQRL
jgi:hypothetical protein